MKKIIISLLLLLSLSACKYDKLSEDTEKRLNNTSVEQLENNGSVKTAITLRGCEQTKNEVFKQTGQQINCENTKQPKDAFFWLVVICAISYQLATFVIIVSISIFIYIKLNEAAAKGKTSQDIPFFKRIALGIVAVVAMIPSVPVFSLKVDEETTLPTGVASYFMFKMLMNTTAQTETSVAEYASEQKIRFPLQTIPHGDSKTHQVAALVNFFVCANASGKASEAKFTFVQSETSIVGTSNVGSCLGTVSYQLDQSAIAIASQNGLFDYKQKQSDEAKRIATLLLTRASAIGNNVAKNYNNDAILKADFDAKRSCEGIYTASISDLSEEAIDSYIKRAATCASTEFVEESNKFPGLTLDYMKSGNYLKGNVVEFCVHDYSGFMKNHIYTKKEALELSKSCLSKACSFGAGAGNGSIAHCSTAINFNNALLHDKMQTEPDFTKMALLAMPTTATSAELSGQIFANSFKVEFEKRADDNEYNTQKNALWSESFILEKGTNNIQYTTFLNYFDKFWNVSTIHNITQNFSIPSLSTLNKLVLVGDNGVLGLGRLFSCVSHPEEFYNGYLCNKTLEEVELAGKNATKAGIDMHLFKAVNISSNVKKEAGEAAIGTVKSMISKYLGNKYAWFFAAYFSSSAYTDSIYGQGSEDIAWSTEVLPLFAALYFIPDLLGFYTFIANTLISVGFLFSFVLPYLPAFFFVIAFATIITKYLLLEVLAPLQIAISLGNEDTIRKDVDFIDPLLQAMLIQIGFAALFMSVGYVQPMLTMIFTVAVEDLPSLISIMTATSSRADGSLNVIATLVRYAFAILLFYYVLKAAISPIRNALNIAEFTMLGRYSDKPDDSIDDEGFYANQGRKISGK